MRSLVGLPEPHVLTAIDVQPAVVDASDPLTGWATVGLAVVAVLTLVYSVITTRTDRAKADERIAEQRDYDDQRAQRERADAEARLADERTAADRRLAEERAHTERLRQRERERDSAVRLLERIASLLPVIGHVQGVFRAVPSVGPLTKESVARCQQAVEGLRFGSVANVPGLGDIRAAEQYRTLVHLVLTAARGEHHQQDEAADKTALRKRIELVAQDLSRYATFVQLSLEHLIEHGASLDPCVGNSGGADVAFPILNRRPGDGSLWSPPNMPAGWQDAIARDPNDPQYRPAQ